MVRNKTLLLITSALCLSISWAFSTQAQESAHSPLPTATLINWTTDYHDGFETAVKEKKPMLIDFYADWCGPCKMMDAQTYTDPRVIKALGDFVSVKIDTDRDQATAFAYRIRSIPRTVVLNIHGEMIGDIVGFMDANDFLTFLSDTRKDALKKVDGTLIVVPKSDAAINSPEKINADTAINQVVDHLVDTEAGMRKSAREELLKRDPEEVRTILLKMLEHEYLGSRIAAWETIATMSSIDKFSFDPWETGQNRKEMLEEVSKNLNTR